LPDFGVEKKSHPSLHRFTPSKRLTVVELTAAVYSNRVISLTTRRGRMFPL